MEYTDITWNGVEFNVGFHYQKFEKQTLEHPEVLEGITEISDLKHKDSDFSEFIKGNENELECLIMEVLK